MRRTAQKVLGFGSGVVTEVSDLAGKTLLTLVRMFSLRRRLRRDFVRGSVIFALLCTVAIFFYVAIDAQLESSEEFADMRHRRAQFLQQRFLQQVVVRVQAVADKDTGDVPPPRRVNATLNENKDEVGEGRMSLEVDADSRFVVESNQLPLPNYNLHAFYYPWYGSPDVDGEYLHWNHPYMPHWDKKQVAKFRTDTHVPPDDVGSNFYPELGPYSSRNRTVLHIHMLQMRMAGIGVLVVSWFPPDKADQNGKTLDSVMSLILNIADKHKLKVAMHSEPFAERKGQRLYDDLKYFIDTYGSHPALYRVKKRTGSPALPFIYVYDSYLTPTEDWINILHPTGKMSIRGTKYDCLCITLLVEEKHKSLIQQANFDGFYTYFAVNGFTYGSTQRNWYHLKQLANQLGKLFIPSVGPGYVDTRVRPWNQVNFRGRNHGMYYASSFQEALKLRTRFVSITSFNEWHEGTQIEPAIPKAISDFTYLDYSPHKPDSYLEATRTWAKLVGK